MQWQHGWIIHSKRKCLKDTICSALQKGSQINRAKRQRQVQFSQQAKQRLIVCLKDTLLSALRKKGFIPIYERTSGITGFWRAM